ncbi:hypothetical protein V6N11_069097 [Hibiscus sabdariffa]|uniref:Uncharacterized protein n=1 Tax=Hibiscus sabdariffa TaxID=183260 RepID=A0ABR2A6D0_9ROSI
MVLFRSEAKHIHVVETTEGVKLQGLVVQPGIDVVVEVAEGEHIVCLQAYAHVLLNPIEESNNLDFPSLQASLQNNKVRG